MNDLLKINGFFADIFPIKEINSKKVETIISIKDDKYKDLVEFSDIFTSQFHNSGVLVNGDILSLELIPNTIQGRVLKEVIENNEIDKKYFITESIEKFKYLKSNKNVRRMNPNGDLYLYTEGSMPFPDSMNKPARTLLTSESSLNRSTHIIEDLKTKKYRLLTPLECERINGFNDY